MLTLTTLIIGLYFVVKGFIYFCLGCYRLANPLYILIFYGVDKAVQSEVERTESYKRFEDELNDML